MLFLFYFLYVLIASNCRCINVEERLCLWWLADYCGRIITSSRLFCCLGPAINKSRKGPCLASVSTQNSITPQGPGFRSLSCLRSFSARV